LARPPQIDQDYLRNTLDRLIAINSVLPHESALAAFIADEIRALGLEPDWDEVAPGRPNVGAIADPGDADRFLVFSGHSDTVPAASDWETDPFRPTVKEGRLYGLGAINMKSGLACMLTAFKALVEGRRSESLPGRLGLAVTVDQEGHSIGAHRLLETEYGKCSAMLHGEHCFGDSKDDYLPIGATGKVLYKLTVKGRAAHALRPHLGGINAVDDASRIVLALDRLRMKEHELFGRGTVCTLKIDGGYKVYAIVVPELCEVIITRLIVPGETVESSVRDMQDLIESLKLESTVRIETPPPLYEPYMLDEGSAIMRAFRPSYKRIVGVDPVFAPHRGIVDANIFVAEGGIQTIVFGPKGGRHHCAGEYVVLDSLAPVAETYVDTAIRYLNER
jgi:acetylornithine deacetylase/succinyl-diaminopimelate desuccinylase-like protein